jgi:phosphoglycerol transferase MdoB-like AlkP superfamily enzyme
VRGASLLLVLVGARAAVVWGRDVPWDVWILPALLWQDVAVALVFAAVERAASGSRIGTAATRALYWVLVVYAAINVPVARVLSTPVTWPMVRATRGALSDSLALHITWPHVLLVLLVLGVAAGLPAVLGRIRPRRPMLVLAAIPMVITGPVALARTDTAGLHRNPLFAMVSSLFPRVHARHEAADWREPPFESHGADDLSHLSGLAAGRNVVLVSLESTAATYLRFYGGADDLTPHLDQLAEHAVVFEHAYAVTPESIKGLFSVLCSRYPAFDVPTDAYAAAPCEPLAGTLRSAGYRTALFHSGRFDYLGMNAVVGGSGFQTMEDAGAIGGQRTSSFGVDEPATVARMLAWIDDLGANEPFFLSYLPIAGHHPYATPQRGPFPDEDDEGRYRNAIHYGDASLGALMDGLRTRGLADRTLWVVYGDHGQAFGQHEGNYGHTFFLYEENVRVPFLVAATGLVAGPRRSRTTVSLIDVAPTLLDLLGIDPPAGYQGESALHGRSRMALFYTDYSLSFVGLRDGRWKFIHELASGRSRLFDMERDGHERRDVSVHHPERVTSYGRTLRGWSAAQKAGFRVGHD